MRRVRLLRRYEGACTSRPRCFKEHDLTFKGGNSLSTQPQDLNPIEPSLERYSSKKIPLLGSQRAVSCVTDRRCREIRNGTQSDRVCAEERGAISPRSDETSAVSSWESRDPCLRLPPQNGRRGLEGCMLMKITPLWAHCRYGQLMVALLDKGSSSPIESIRTTCLPFLVALCISSPFSAVLLMSSIISCGSTRAVASKKLWLVSLFS